MRAWWHEQPDKPTVSVRLKRLARIFGEFFRDSLPDRKRQRFGDAGYDWDHRVDTTSANVSWRARFVGLLNSSYQPIEAEIFREMMAPLAIDFRQFTFVDVGSGKGRALLLASAFPFRRIIGIELLPELHQIAQANIAKFASSKELSPIESICKDATRFDFPVEPMVMFLFHPLLETGFRKVLENLVKSMNQHPRPVYIVYANPVFEMLLAAEKGLQKIDGTHQWAVYEARES